MKRSIEASKQIPVPYAAASLVLRDDPAAVLTDFDDRLEHRTGPVFTEVGVDFNAGVGLHRTVVVHSGVVSASVGEMTLPVTWRAVDRARLLPVFSGDLNIVDAGIGTRVSLSGNYSVPFGIAGLVGDCAVGRRFARRSLDGLVDGIGRRLEAEVERRKLQAVPQQRLHAAADDGARSEIFIG